MEIELLIQEKPRSLALRTDYKGISYGLLFRYTRSKTPKETVPQGAKKSNEANSVSCVVEFEEWTEKHEERFESLSVARIYGCLGLIQAEGDVFLVLITGAGHAGTLRQGEHVSRIHNVHFYSLTSAKWDYSGTPWSSTSIDKVDQTTDNSEHSPCVDLQKLFSSGSFYFSADTDITNSLQNRSFSDNAKFDIERFDQSFLWNTFMVSELLKFRSRLESSLRACFDGCFLIAYTMQGFVKSVPCTFGGIRCNLAIVSRLSCKRAGTRFNSRGIDDDGNVSNFVETEVLIDAQKWSYSFCQVRGSVPAFWEHVGQQLLGQNIAITRGLEATMPAFELHFRNLVKKYGPVHIIDLLSAKTHEKELSKFYAFSVAALPATIKKQIVMTHFDFHAETKGSFEYANNIRPSLDEDVASNGFYLESSGSLSPILQQNGVFRTNCLDCLDRTNVIQGLTSQMAIELLSTSAIREKIGNNKPSYQFWQVHSSLWADNGDALSKIYAGTGALKSSFTRKGKMSIAGAISDATKSVSRLYINNFSDKSKQSVIDFLLGRLQGQVVVSIEDPIGDYVNAELAKRASEYSWKDSINIYVVTHNLHGKSMDRHNAAKILYPGGVHHNAQIVAVGVQEIVELNAQQILSTDPSKKRSLESLLLAELNARKDNSSEYVLLRSGQLVGTALMIFVQSSCIPYIRGVEGSVKKTGLKGMSGNKGAVAIRMDYAASKLCFVTAHFASGQSAWAERNQDYRTISEGLQFLRGRTIHGHDSIIYFGDFNYRIDLPNEEVRTAVKNKNYADLHEKEQLNMQMVAGKVFQYFSEGEINFAPTYKFDNGTNIYDTSEKARAPAWTDRILHKGSNIKLWNYTSLDSVIFSDHRPVCAKFSAKVTFIDETKKTKLARALNALRHEHIEDPIMGLFEKPGEKSKYEEVEKKLPSPSSETQKWWLDGGQTAKAIVMIPVQGYTRNAKSPINPFEKNGQPDWVKISSPSEVSSSTENSSYHSELKTGVVRRVLAPPVLPPRRSSPIVLQSVAVPPPLPLRTGQTPPNRTFSTSSSITPPIIPKRLPSEKADAEIRRRRDSETSTKSFPSSSLIDSENNFMNGWTPLTPES